MRENMLLAKAKTVRDKTWVEGYYSKQKKCDRRTYCPEFGYEDILVTCHYITNEAGRTWEVDPETVCECTGLKAKRNILLFEKDIIASPVCEYVVEYKGGAFWAVPIESKNRYGCPEQLILADKMFTFIGNTHDNPV